MLTTISYPRRCRTGGVSVTRVSASPSTLPIRPKLPVRSYVKPRYTYITADTENACFGRPKRFRIRKMISLQKMDIGKKKMLDYTETAYREAVSKLKYLLAESCPPGSAGCCGHMRVLLDPSEWNGCSETTGPLVLSCLHPAMTSRSERTVKLK